MNFTIDWQSLVTVGSKSADKMLGTGFSFIRGDWIVTAKHVVVVDNIPRNDIFVAALGRGPLAATVLGLHPRIDIAILQCAELGCRRPLLPAHHNFVDNQVVIYAGLRPSLTTKDGVVVEVNQGFNGKHALRERLDIEECFEFESAISDGGHSGGPVFAEKGGVLGLIIDSFERDGKLMCRATSVLPVLESLEVPSHWQR